MQRAGAKSLDNVKTIYADDFNILVFKTLLQLLPQLFFKILQIKSRFYPKYPWSIQDASSEFLNEVFIYIVINSWLRTQNSCHNAMYCTFKGKHKFCKNRFCLHTGKRWSRKTRILPYFTCCQGYRAGQEQNIILLNSS